MAKQNGKEGFEINEKKLAEVMQIVWSAVENKRGIFRDGLKRFLPQWNLPKELEYDPQEVQVKNPESAARFLFTRTSIDKMSDSGYLHRKTLEAWNDSNKNWIFNSKEVQKREISEIETALKNYFSYALPIHPRLSAAQGYLMNAKRVAEEFDNDPRNLIRYKEVSQARKILMEMHGFGTGLANLFMMECNSREIASPLDSYNLRPKIDRHKARIPLNTDVVTLKNGTKEKGSIHSNYLVRDLEEAYVKVARDQGLSLTDIDHALWIIGSEVCMRSNYHNCATNCPLSKGVCIANTVLNGETGFFDIYDENGKRLDSRKQLGQGHFEI